MYRSIPAILGLAFGFLLVAPALPRADERGTQETFEYLDLFGNILERVRSNYVEEVDDVELIQAAIRGMLSSLDPHSGYLDPESFNDMQVQTRGEFGGLGIEITQENGFVKVVSPIDDTPADRAGLEAGDFITHVDGESILGLTLQESVDLLRGEVGSPVTVTVARDGTEPFDIDIVRDIIQIRAVRQRAENEVGYIRITTFSQNVSDDLDKAFQEIDREIGADQVRGYVLDLRNNPGGLLEQAVAVSDAFLERGEIVSTRGRDPEDIERHNAKPGDLADGLPVVVLVNGGSASASEIVSGALQDHRRAVVVGTKTFGKGSVQTISPIGRDKGALRLTIARYYTPSGRSIQGRGLQPDIIVEHRPASDSEAEEPAGRPRSKEADLRGSIDDGLEDDTQAREEEEQRRRAEAAAELRLTDNQLAYALDLIHGLSFYR